MWQGNEALRAPAEFPPRWAASFGDDPYGLWADLALTSKVQMRFRWIEPGWFWMGSDAKDKAAHSDEKPQHVVHITEGFWMAETPVTFAQWMAKIGDEKRGALDHPVNPVSWNEVEKYMKLCGNVFGGDAVMTFPSEAQWEYACRAGTSSAYWWGDEASKSRMNFGGDRRGATSVKTFEPNPWGLYDMHGNVWEWCLDRGRREYRAQEELNPVSTKETDSRAMRGGSWFNSADDARAAYRYDSPRDSGWNFRGFRPVLRSLQGLARQEAGSPEAERGETPSDGPRYR